MENMGRLLALGVLAGGAWFAAGCANDAQQAEAPAPPNVSAPQAPGGSASGGTESAAPEGMATAVLNAKGMS